MAAIKYYFIHYSNCDGLRDGEGNITIMTPHDHLNLKNACELIKENHKGTVIIRWFTEITELQYDEWNK